MPQTVDYEKLGSFIATRRKATGGYGATRELPATVEDTYEAVGLLGIIGSRVSGSEPPIEDAALARYLGRVQAAPWLGMATTFQMLATCRKLGLALNAERVRGYADAALAETPSLETSYYVARIAHEVMAMEPGAWLGLAPNLAVPQRRTVDHVRMLVAVTKLLGQPVAEAAALTGWLRRSQNGDGGFGFFPGTTSFIENSHGALAALALLDARPENPAAAHAYVVSCQTGAGGFGRSPVAAPFLDASWHAVRALQLLESMG